MRRRRVKEEVLTILADREQERVRQRLQVYPTSQLLPPLFASLCHLDQRVRWNGVFAFGRVVPALAVDDPEAARVVMRRLLWSLNDESGGIGWGAPEAMAEILCHSSLLRREYRHLLFSYMREDGPEPFQEGNYLELPFLQRGLLWGIGRLCARHPVEMRRQGIEQDLVAYLDSADLQVVGLAIRALGFLAVPGNEDPVEDAGSGSDTDWPWAGPGRQKLRGRIDRYRHHHHLVEIYDACGTRQTTLGQLAEEACRLLP